MESALAPLFIAPTCRSKCIKHNANVTNHTVKQPRIFGVSANEGTIVWFSKEGRTR